MTKKELSGVIITKNESANIARCITSLQKVTDDIIVVDDYSEDDTCIIAEAMGARVFQRDWEGYSRNKNFGNAQAKNDWILSLDADEELSDALVQEIRELKVQPGIAWMVNGNMACGTLGDDLMVRLDPDDAERALREPHVGPMDFTGRPMRGFIKVGAEAIASDADLARWIDTGASFAAGLPPKA